MMNTMPLKIIGFVAWIAVSFYSIYYFMAGELRLPTWIYPSIPFAWLAILVVPVSLWLAYLLIRGHVSSHLYRLKVLVGLAGILLIAGFTMIQWTAATTSYGNIESFTAGNGAKHLMLSESELASMSLFEQKTLLRETAVDLYDHAFKRIWTFSGIILAMVLLLLSILQTAYRDK